MTTINATIEFNKQDLVREDIQYEPTGEVRQVKEGEHYLDPYLNHLNSRVSYWFPCGNVSAGKYVILKPVTSVCKTCEGMGVIVVNVDGSEKIALCSNCSPVSEKPVEGLLEEKDT
jgi:hypothetical protein